MIINTLASASNRFGTVTMSTCRWAAKTDRAPAARIRVAHVRRTRTPCTRAPLALRAHGPRLRTANKRRACTLRTRTLHVRLAQPLHTYTANERCGRPSRTHIARARREHTPCTRTAKTRRACYHACALCSHALRALHANAHRTRTAHA